LMLQGDAGQASAAGETSQPLAVGAQPPTLYELERQHILRVLSEAGGNRERAAAILGISARTLYRKLREYETSNVPADFNAG
jgi:DNA-binding NtrC family response regulator